MEAFFYKLISSMTTRRHFIKQTAQATAAMAIPGAILSPLSSFYTISLAQFSLAPAFFSKKMDTLDFPAKAKNDFGLEAVEYVSMFFKDKVSDSKYISELKKRSDDLGVRNVLIMIDMEGDLGASDPNKRQLAIDNHTKWIEVAKVLGCHSIRVNINGDGTDEQIFDAALEGYGKLVSIGAKMDMGVIIENHNGPTNNPEYLAKLMKQINNPYAGTLPDFGNFIRRSNPEAATIEAYAKTKVIAEYDKYKGVEMLMPYAKGVSAKTHAFNEDGSCKETDFKKIMAIVEKHKTKAFKGYVGIEYEGGFLRMMNPKENYLSEDDGIRATKKLLM
jgi:sugar phosphate isomerase/epimerase